MGEKYQMFDENESGCKCTDQSATIADLRFQLKEAQAYQVHNLHFVSSAIEKFTTEYLFGGGVMLELTALGGKRKTSPVIIRDGLSPETVAAIQEDLRRSYKDAIRLKPVGYSE